ncbi:MAG: TolC family protein [Moraxella sp.]|nr:TolC family protein [Moraxella sp.]
MPNPNIKIARTTNLNGVSSAASELHKASLSFGKGITSACSLAMLMMALPAWANINPLEVNELIGQAVQTHPLIGSAIADEQAAAEGVTAAKLNLLPTPSIATTHDNNRGMVATATVRQYLWTGGQLTANINQAIYDEKAATAYIFEQQNTVAKNTIDIWQSYIYAIALQDLYLDNLARLAEFEAQMTRRVAQGVSARIELDLVKNRILQDQNSFQGAKEQQAIAEARLEQLIGQPINSTNAKVPMALLVRYAKEQSRPFAELAFGDVSETNPAVMRQRFQVEAARHEHKAQRASRYPSVYAQYSHDFYLEEGENNGQFSVGMSYSPGAGFSNLALARASEARVHSLLQTQEAARRTAMEAIQTQYQQFVSSRDQELSLTAAVAGAKIVTNSYRRQFIAGRKSWLEVLNAVRDESQYEQQLLQVQAQMVANFYKLQVDFGSMPWQQTNNGMMATPVSEFRAIAKLSDWLSVHTGTDDTPAARPDEFEEYFLADEEGFVLDEISIENLQNPTTRQATNFTLVTSPLGDDVTLENNLENNQ